MEPWRSGHGSLRELGKERGSHLSGEWLLVAAMELGFEKRKNVRWRDRELQLGESLVLSWDFFQNNTLLLTISLVSNIFKLFRKLASRVSQTYKLDLTIATRVSDNQVDRPRMY